MTISGAISEMATVVGIEFLLADHAQEYIKSMATELENLDGKPVHLVHDCETGTSDIIIAELENALRDGEDIVDLPVAKILHACFKNGWGFRIWWANDSPIAFMANVSRVADLTETCAAIKEQRGATWRGAASGL